MRKVKTLFYADIVLSLAALALLLVWKLIIRGERPGFLVTGLSALLLVNAALCLVSAAMIDKGRGRQAARLWLSVLALAVSYALLDILGGLYVNLTVTKYNMADSYVHHKLRPGVREKMRNSRDFDAVLTTNTAGFRGGEIGSKKPGVYRIVMLGDSFTMGEGVGDNETFSKLIESLLNEKGQGNYEVLNLGVESYSPVLEYLLLKKEIGALEPDMVVLNFDMSDLQNESYYRDLADYDKEGAAASVNGIREREMLRSNHMEWAYIWARSHLMLTNTIIKFLERWTGSGTENEHQVLLMHTLDIPQPENTASLYEMVEDSIMRAKDLCEEHGCKFVLSVYPWGHQVNDGEWVPGRYDFIPRGVRISDRTVDELRAFAGRNGIDFFDAFPSFRAYHGGEKLYFRHDMHWTPAGQMLMARSLGGFIEKEIKKKPDSDGSFELRGPE